LLALPDVRHPVEHYHDAHFALAEARTRFTQDKLSIIDLAKARMTMPLFVSRLKAS